MSSIGVYSNTDKCEPRREDDFYPTPWEATEAILKREDKRIWQMTGGRLWESSCGEGHISEVLKEHGFTVFSTDLIDRGYGQGGVDFLTTKALPHGVQGIFTNPPFDISEGFIRHALTGLGVPYMALLLKAHYFHADCRVKLFRDYPPARVYPCAWRIDFTGGGANHTDCSWYIWDSQSWADGLEDTAYKNPLEKPLVRGMANLL